MTAFGVAAMLELTESHEAKSTDSSTGRVVAARSEPLPWSGPLGWRNLRPVLEAKKASGLANLTTGSDAGFSLVELMIALLVLAILLAIAIPTFVGTTTSADNRSVQANLNTAMTDAIAQFQSGGQTFFVNGVQDSVGFAGLLTAAQLSMTFHAGQLGTSTTQGSSGSLSTISVAVSSDGSGVALASYTAPGNCFYAVDNSAALTLAAKGLTPYLGSTVTTVPTLVSAGAIGLPSTLGSSFVEVKGDTNPTDCNAYTPKASGSLTTVQYLTSGFPN